MAQQQTRTSKQQTGSLFRQQTFAQPGDVLAVVPAGTSCSVRRSPLVCILASMSACQLRHAVFCTRQMCQLRHMLCTRQMCQLRHALHQADVSVTSCSALYQADVQRCTVHYLRGFVGGTTSAGNVMCVGRPNTSAMVQP
jgi:hypothetical protein